MGCSSAPYNFSVQRFHRFEPTFHSKDFIIRHFLRMANLRTTILDFRGFVSSGILVLRGGTFMSIEHFPGRSLSQRILAGLIFVGRLGVGIVASESRPVPAVADLRKLPLGGARPVTVAVVTVCWSRGYCTCDFSIGHYRVSWISYGHMDIVWYYS